MPNIAFILNGKIARVARKQIRSEVAALRNASSTQRSEIAALKRQAAALEKQAKALPASMQSPNVLLATTQR